MSKEAKLLRGAVRIVVKEHLTEELVKSVEEKLIKLINTRLDKLEKYQKDILGFVVRNTAMKK